MIFNRSEEDIQYDARLTANKKLTLDEITAMLRRKGILLSTRETNALDAILHRLISKTIVTSGGTFHAWKEQAR